MDLNHKLAVVTGSSKGIGLATVQALLAKGARVAGWSRSLSSLSNANLKSYTVDVRDFNAVKMALEKTVDDFGIPPSVLINNAGLGFEASLEDLTLDQWHKMFDTNVNGMFYCTKLILPLMKKAGQGHIINISSVAGLGGIPGMTGYCATKYAVSGFSNALFKEVRKDGIKVSCIFPGAVKTKFFDTIDSVPGQDQMMFPEDVAATIVHCLEAPANFNPVNIEVRPIRAKG